jgi:hypothetical protein
MVLAREMCDSLVASFAATFTKPIRATRTAMMATPAISADEE